MNPSQQQNNIPPFTSVFPKRRTWTLDDPQTWESDDEEENEQVE